MEIIARKSKRAALLLALLCAGAGSVALLSVLLRPQGWGWILLSAALLFTYCAIALYHITRLPRALIGTDGTRLLLFTPGTSRTVPLSCVRNVDYEARANGCLSPSFGTLVLTLPEETVTVGPVGDIRKTYARLLHLWEQALSRPGSLPVADPT